MLFGLFAFLSLTPLLVFGAWSNAEMANNALREAQDRNLLLARNLGAALERYQRDASATFDLVAANLARHGTAGPTEKLLGNLGFRHICLADAATGVVAEASPGRELCPARLSAAELKALAPVARAAAPAFTPVTTDRDGQPVLYLARILDGRLAVGALDTDTIERLAQQVPAGRSGHAVIVDHAGNVLAHPAGAWFAERQNIAGVPAVERMLNGESGVRQFYSPSLNGQVLAGFAAVKGTGWGVMVPQPVDEIIGVSGSARLWTLALALGCLVMASALSMAVADHVGRPLRRIVRASRAARESDLPTEVEPSAGWALPRELNEVQTSFNEMVRCLRENLAEIRHMAFSDGVTDLPNREAFRALCRGEIARLRAQGGTAALLYIELDDFKAINDTLGHDQGDAVLQHLGRRLVGAVAEASGRQPRGLAWSDERGLAPADGAPIVGRVGGEEFNVFVPGLGEDALVGLLKSLKACLDAPVHFGEEVAGIGASIGAARFPADGESFELLLKRADIAMYHAKRAGKNCYQVYGDEIGDMTVAEMRRNVSHGIRNGEFTLFYQPKIRAGMIRVDGVEALVRWQHPSGRLVTPGAFIPVIENSDVIVELGDWVVRAAAADMDDLRRGGLATRVSVNISARQFCADGFAESISRAIRETGIDPSMLELEITEEAILSNLAATRSAIKELQATEVRIALDDFGRGYSNLSRVADLAVDTIKIDGPLTARVTTEDRVKVIIKSTVDMARGLGCETVAEGVETLEQAACLTKLGCTHLQGYYFAKPMDLETLKGWITSQHSSQVGEIQTLIEERIRRIA